MSRYKLTIEYEGTRFRGWQRQAHEPSVQETIENALKSLLKQDIRVEGAGRTDAGVHALGQVAHLDLLQPMPPYRLRDGLNNFLRGHGIAILNVQSVPPNFHARFSATGRIYEYRILNRRAPLALEENRAWHVICALNVDDMQKAANHLLGHHDFSSFRASYCQSPSPLKTLDAFEIHQTPLEEGSIIKAHVASRSFLHNQVRIMIGTLKLVGEGRLGTDDVLSILEACNRSASGPTAPPQGLYLKSVAYNVEED